MEDSELIKELKKLSMKVKELPLRRIKTNTGANMFQKYLHGPNVHIHIITDDSVCLSGMCTSGKYHEIVVDKQNLVDYNSGALIQDAFPTLSASEREFLMTGMCCDPIWDSE